MILLLDIGNTHTHLGLANAERVIQRADIPTSAWKSGRAPVLAAKFARRHSLSGVSLCSVVPHATPFARRMARGWNLGMVELTWRTLRGLGIDYPKPKTIGPDRLANAVAAKRRFGAPVVVVDFGTAVTFDVVDAKGNYAGGIIAPGLAAMTEYLHEKTALLPRIRICEVTAVVGKSTREAMQIGAVHGYRGLVRELVRELRRELGCRSIPVVATGGYAELIAARVPEITAVDPLLTLEGLRLTWEAHDPGSRLPAPIRSWKLQPG
jgi:type III pantothenate kinase